MKTLSQNPDALYAREYYLKHPEKLDENLIKSKVYRRRKALEKVTKNQKFWASSLKSMKQNEQICAMWKRRPDVAKLVIWFGFPESKVRAALKAGGIL